MSTHPIIPIRPAGGLDHHHVTIGEKHLWEKVSFSRLSRGPTRTSDLVEARWKDFRHVSSRAMIGCGNSRPSPVWTSSQSCPFRLRSMPLGTMLPTRTFVGGRTFLCRRLLVDERWLGPPRMHTRRDWDHKHVHDEWRVRYVHQEHPMSATVGVSTDGISLA